MEELFAKIRITVNEKIYLKDPESSDIGKEIISKSIEMIDELGFEDFTFRKLGQKIGSPESTVYRYFENKHNLLVYLVSWYWSWLEYRLVFAISNINSKEERLKRAIKSITEPVVIDNNFQHINEAKLHNLVINEASKSYHTKLVDEENKEGYYHVYKKLVNRVSNMVLDINPNYKFPNSLISTVIEGAQCQKYFKDHLPSLTNFANENYQMSDFFTDLVFNAINVNHE
ncbi:MAG: TetR/AcrR family transcriptional regulator [Cyclobacteriaceae bacterium]|nr:TetR/AcrR family transcriptional regulator [Cyclobacteriaceae bacterium]